MKKVLFVATVASHIKGFHEPYLKLFKDNDYKTYVAANWNLKENDKINFCDEFIQIPIKRSPYSIQNIKAIMELKKVIEKEKFDIVHCHTPMGSVVARLAAKEARKNGTRVIYTAHGYHFYKGAPLVNWLMFYPVEWYLAKYTDTLITINQEDFKRARRKFKRRCNNIEYVSGVGIDETKFYMDMPQNERNHLKEILGLKKDDIILTCIARLDRNKNQGTLIKSMKKLIKEYSNIHLLLVGRDELNGKYQRQVKLMNLENNIHFLGIRNDVSQILHITDVALSASKREGLPVNVLEALCVGIPVVAYKCRGIDDLIENNVNGVIVNNFNDYASAVNKAINMTNIVSNDIKEFDDKLIRRYEYKEVLKNYDRIYRFK